MKLKRHVTYTKYGSFIGFTGAKLRKHPRPPIGRSESGITSGIHDCGPVSWLARLCYRFGMRKLAGRV
jgi:hypothetical protein